MEVMLTLHQPGRVLQRQALSGLGATLSIGRGLDDDLTAVDPAHRISRQHLRVSLVAGGCEAEISGTTGVEIDGRMHGPGERAMLADGALCRVGDTARPVWLLVSVAGQTAAAPAHGQVASEADAPAEAHPQAAVVAADSPAPAARAAAGSDTAPASPVPDGVATPPAGESATAPRAPSPSVAPASDRRQARARARRRAAKSIVRPALRELSQAALTLAAATGHALTAIWTRALGIAGGLDGAARAGLAALGRARRGVEDAAIGHRAAGMAEGLGRGIEHGARGLRARLRAMARDIAAVPRALRATIAELPARRLAARRAAMPAAEALPDGEIALPPGTADCLSLPGRIVAGRPARLTLRLERDDPLLRGLVIALARPAGSAGAQLVSATLEADPRFARLEALADGPVALEGDRALVWHWRLAPTRPGHLVLRLALGLSGDLPAAAGSAPGIRTQVLHLPVEIAEADGALPGIIRRPALPARAPMPQRMTGIDGAA